MILFNDENVEELVKALFQNDEFKEKLNELISSAGSDQIGDEVSNYMSGLEIDADNISGLGDKIEHIINNASISLSV